MERLTRRYDTHVAVVCENCHKPGHCMTAEDCNEVLRNRLAAYEDTGLEPEEIKTILREQEERRWIPVTERLPKLIPFNAGTGYSEAVMILTSGRKVMDAIWDGIDWIAPFDFWDAWGENVTHWMPLPHPPKGECQVKTTGTPCRKCKHREKQTYEQPCCWCISDEDIVLAHINPEHPVDFTRYEPAEGE